MVSTDAGLERLHALDREYRHLGHAAGVLQWDQETMLPLRGVEDRAEQLALLEGIAHGKLAAPETGRLLESLGSVSACPRGDEKLPPAERDFLRVMRRNYDREVKLPPDFVSAAARAGGLSQAAWVQARKADNFALFLPHLEKMLDLARQKARFWGYGDSVSQSSVYDGLLDIYEPDMGAGAIGALFVPLRERLSSLLKKIKRCPGPDASFLDREFDTGAQNLFCRRLMDYLGFDRDRGRLDVSAHPFTATLGSSDIRITTRYDSKNILSGIFSVIHESGHAFYEMGFPPGLRGSCLADGASMAVHESQSRFWENVIGRGRPFWTGLFPVLRSFFPSALGGVEFPAFFRAVNRVKPSLIRVDADEVSYALHIILRFELERGLFSGEIAAGDLPRHWREKTRDLLGLESETDAEGVLQDIHWSQGSFGYFPSYALGNLYALQFFDKLRGDLPDFDEAIERGCFTGIKSWLTENIYRWGCRLEPAELLKKVSGESLSPEPFLKYIETKYTGLYGI
jgi:carboxypeptidase Taq